MPSTVSFPRIGVVLAAVCLLAASATSGAEDGNGEPVTSTATDAEVPHIVLVGPDNDLRVADELTGFGATFDFAVAEDANVTQLKPPVDVPSLFRATPANANPTEERPVENGTASAPAPKAIESGSANSESESSSGGTGCSWDNWQDHWSPGASQRDGCCVCHSYASEETVRRCMSCCCSKGYTPWRYLGCKGMSRSANPECTA
eukprot:jgi/Tetstr1/437681/TSEL_000239.t1